jgi:UDP-GlcNAc:undecaprenyl-phosphate GlcNAc-1-phosphate transferase
MIYFFAFIFALFGTVVGVPFSIYLARRFDVMDYPKARKVHRQPLPRWGGIGIYIGFAAAMLLLFAFPAFRELLSYKYKTIELAKLFWGVGFSGTLIFVLGAIDDKKSVKAMTKLLVMIIAAYIAMDYGVRITGLVLPWHNTYFDFPLIISQLVTVLWIIGFMNTVNLADGLDGLAAGIVAIASATFFVVALLQGQTGITSLAKQLSFSAVMAAALCGACLGFLIYNFNPAKVFMGDSGALFIGFLLAAISAVGTLKSTAVLALFIPIVAVALPIADVALSIFRRLRKGAGIMEPDKEHIHHRLLSYGWTHREVVLLMYIFTLILSIGAILLTVFKGRV